MYHRLCESSLDRALREGLEVDNRRRPCLISYEKCVKYSQYLFVVIVREMDAQAYFRGGLDVERVYCKPPCSRIRVVSGKNVVYLCGGTCAALGRMY